MIFVVCYLIDRQLIKNRFYLIFFPEFPTVYSYFVVHLFLVSSTGRTSIRTDRTKQGSQPPEQWTKPSNHISAIQYFMVNQFVNPVNPTSLTDVASFDFEHFACASRWRDEGRDKSLSKRCPPSL